MPAREFRSQLLRLALIVSTLLASWLAMQAVHELGHVSGAWLTGGRVARVVLHPATISRTDLTENPHPLAVAWCGPLVGAVMPLLLWLLAAGRRLPGTFVLRFFAGFCLIANGAYLAAGAWAGIGDAGDLLRHGSPTWCLWLFGVVAVPAGLRLWHRQGRHFGLGAEPDHVPVGVVCGVCVACAGLAIVGLLLGGR
jgi:hypothetical protein